MPALGGGLFVADTSAFARRGHPEVREEWAEALRSGQILICSPVELELLYSARDLAMVEHTSRVLSSLRRLPLTESCSRSASSAMRELARRGAAGSHRVPPIDCLVAACAQEAGAGVLHYDRDYDRLAQVMAFESRWILPAGSVD